MPVFAQPLWQLLILTELICCAAASTVGVALIYPGFKSINFGSKTALSSPPFLSGLGPVYLTWGIAPLLSLTCVTALFLILRTWLLRGEDPFHKVIWVRSSVEASVSML